MNLRVYAVDIFSDESVDVTFFDGAVKRFDVKRLSAYNEKFAQLLSDKKLYQEVNVVENNNGIKWGNNVDYFIDNETLYYDGILIEKRVIGDAKVQLAARLTQIRESLGLTQKELEKKTGIHQADISKIERGIANPSVETLERIAAAMDCTISHDFIIRSNEDEGEYVRGNLARNLSVWRKQGEYTVDDIMALPEGVRAELVDGVIYDMAPPLIVHQRILFHIAYEIERYIRDNKGACEVLISPVGVLLSEEDNKNYFEPDMVIVCDPEKIKERFIVNGPDFVLEVTSESTSSRDYTIKKEKYKGIGVREYWIVDTKRKRLIVYLADTEYNTPEIHTFDETVGIHIYDDKVKIDLQQLSL